MVTHTRHEGPLLLGEWLPADGLALDVVEPWRGEELPGSLAGYGALVVMGGPMGAYDDKDAPWLPATRALLARAVADGVPTLGVCLGAQLLAVATGGRVEVGPAGPELGLGDLVLTPAAADDPLLGDLPREVRAVQWHHDHVVDLPPHATLLASSPRYPHQAFRVGPAAWGLQFHPEVDVDTVAGWAGHDEAALTGAGTSVAAELERVRTSYDELVAAWRPVAEAFARLVPGPVGGC